LVDIDHILVDIDQNWSISTIKMVDIDQKDGLYRPCILYKYVSFTQTSHSLQRIKHYQS
jgi:hypothetical protein